MDFQAAIDWVSAFPMLASIRDTILLLVRLLPWAGTGAFAYAVFGGDAGIKFVYRVREWLKGTKAVASELDAKVDARLDAQDRKLDAILEAIKPKA